MAEEIRLDVVSVAHSRGLKDAAGDLGRLSAEADKTAKGFHRAKDETFSLDAAIGEARAEIQKLNEEFKRTGDTSLFRSMRRQRSELAQLLKVAGEGAGGGGIELAGGMRSMRGPLIGVAVGAVAILSPVIGAAIAGAVTGAVGLGGIVGGVASAAKDPAVKSAAKQFGADISKEFFQGDAFVQPVVDSLGILKREFEGLNLAGTFAKTAPFLTDLAEGLGGFAREFGESFSHVLDRSGEFIPVLADGITRLGDGLGSMIEEMAASEGAVEGLRFIFEFTAQTAHVLGVTVRWLGDQFDTLGRFSANLSGALEDVAEVIPFVNRDNNIFSRINDQIESVTGTSDEFEQSLRKVERSVTATGEAVAGTSDSWNQSQAQIDAAKRALEEYNEATAKSISMALAIDNANLGLAQAMLNLNEELREGSKDWRTNTQEGIDNRRALLAAVEAAERKRQADIASGVDADKANAAYQRTINKLHKMARQAGISEKALDDLVGDYNINIHVKTHGEAVGGAIGGAISKALQAKGKATGGPVGQGTYIVGERGPEVLQLGQGSRGHVYPSFGAFAGSRGGAVGGSARPINIIINGTHEDRELIARIAREVGKQGGTLAVLGIRG